MKYVRLTLAAVLLAVVGFIAWRTISAPDLPPMSDVDEVLQQRVLVTRRDVRFDDTPLGEVTVRLSQLYGMPVSHEFESLGAESIGARIPVRVNAANASIIDVFRQIRPAALRDGRFVLTTPNIASEEPRLTRVIDRRKYNVSEEHWAGAFPEFGLDTRQSPIAAVPPDNITRVGDLHFVRGSAFAHFAFRVALEDVRSKPPVSPAPP